MGHLFDPAGDMSTGNPSNQFEAEINGLTNTSNQIPGQIRLEGVSHYQGMLAQDILQHSAERLPNREAIRYRKKSWSYNQLNIDAIRCAKMLKRIGVKPGDRVGILLPNIPEYLIAVNGIWRAGGVVVAISPLMVNHEIDKFLELTDCRFVICLDLLAHMVEREKWKATNPVEKVLLVSIRDHLSAREQIGYFSMRHKNTGRWRLPTNNRRGWFWNEIKRTKKTELELDLVDPATTPAYILPSGGTTGRPAPVSLSHQNLAANAWQQYMWAGKPFGTGTMMGVLPFFQCYGFSTVMGGFMMGFTLVLHDRFNTRQIMKLIEQERPSIFHAVPSMLVAMNRYLRTRATDLTSLEWVISGGAGLEEAVGREFAEHTGALVVEGYGLSEASPVTHVGDLFAEQRYGVIGLPLPETECKVVDADTGMPVQPGELLLRGPQVMLGYWDNESETEIAIQDGWLHTGDLVVRHADGNFSIVGRKKELIITSGFNVYPGEVATVIRELDMVEDVAVRGTPDRKRGEVVTALIVLRAGFAWDADAIRDYCNQRLSKHKRPRSFEQVEVLPEK